MGDLDVVLTQIGGPPLLLHQRPGFASPLDSFETRRPPKVTATPLARGSRVRVNGQTLWRQVMPTRAYLSQSELPVTIGLGNTDKVDSVEINWPSGTKQKVENVLADQPMTVTELGKCLELGGGATQSQCASITPGLFCQIAGCGFALSPTSKEVKE